MEMIFVSDDKKRFVTTIDGSPCFMRKSHIQIGNIEGLELDKMENLTFKFHAEGKGKSIKEFLNNV